MPKIAYISFLMYSAIWCSSLSAQDFCALRVTVHNYKGVPVSDVPVAVRSRGGAVFGEGRTGNSGSVEFCDIGLELIEVVVGVPLCGQVVVRDLFDRHPSTIELKVLYENCHAAAMRLDPTCDVLIRVNGAGANALSGVTVETNNQTWITDHLGRVRMRIPRNAAMAFAVYSPGFNTGKLHVSCIGGLSRFEQIVTLMTKETKLP